MKTVRKEINTISSVGVIYQRSNPGNIFAEVKDEGYPHVEWRHHLFLVGGSAVDAEGKTDRSPLVTFCREADEELMIQGDGHADVAALAEVKAAIKSAAVPFQDYFFHIPHECFVRANPQTRKKKSWQEIATAILVPLDDDTWATLGRLQVARGNLSIESNSCLTSIGRALSGETKVSWEVAHILQHFWLEQGFVQARNLPLFDGVVSERLGAPCETYADYMGYTLIK